MFSSSPTFSRADLSSSLSAAKHRFKLHHDASRNKKTRARSEIAALLLKKQFDLAKIRAESLVAQQWQVEAEEVLGLMCELLRSRIDLICSSSHTPPSSSSTLCPPELRESVITLVFAAPRTDIDELKDVRTQLRLRFTGSADKAAFELAAKGDPNSMNGVNQSVVDRLSVGGEWQTEHLFDKTKELLTEIATENGISGFDANKDLAESKIGYGGGSGSSTTRDTTSSKQVQTPPPQQTQPQQPHPDAVLPPNSGFINTNTMGSNWTITAPPAFSMGVHSSQQGPQQGPQQQFQQGPQQFQQQFQPYQQGPLPQQSYQQGFASVPGQGSAGFSSLYIPSASVTGSNPASVFPTYIGCSGGGGYIPQPHFFVDPLTGQPHLASFSPMQNSSGLPSMQQQPPLGGMMMMQFPAGASASPFSPFMPLAIPSSALNGGGSMLVDTGNYVQQQQQQQQQQLLLQLQQQQQIPPGFGTSLPSGSLVNGCDGRGGGGGGGAPLATQGFSFGGPTQIFPSSSSSSSTTSSFDATTSDASQTVASASLSSSVAVPSITTSAPRSARSASFRRAIYLPRAIDEVRSSRGDVEEEEDDEGGDEEGEERRGDDGGDPESVKQTIPSTLNQEQLRHQQQQQQVPQLLQQPQSQPQSQSQSLAVTETTVSDLQKRLAALRGL